MDGSWLIRVQMTGALRDQEETVVHTDRDKHADRSSVVTLVVLQLYSPSSNSETGVLGASVETSEGDCH